MRVCPECETPVGEEWEHCLRCDAVLPSVPAAPPSLGERMRLPFQGLRDAMGDRLVGLSALRVRRWAIPAAAIGVGAALALVGVAFATLGPTDPDIEAARAAEAAAEAQVAEISAVLDGAEASRRALIDDLDAAQARIATLEDQTEAGAAMMSTLQETSTALEAELAAAEAAALDQEELVAAQTSRIEALSECLSGTQVALQFARDGLMGPADRAMEAVAVACFEARRGD